MVLTDLLVFSRYPVSFRLLVEFWCAIERKVLFVKNNKRRLVTVKLPICFLIPGPVLAGRYNFLNLGEYPRATT